VYDYCCCLLLKNLKNPAKGIKNMIGKKNRYIPNWKRA
jgi:hypothetical protein